MSVTQDLLVAARDAIARNAWSEALDLYQQADAQGGLPPEDLQGLADAAVWFGKGSVAIEALERAYAAYVQRGDRREAARTALSLAKWHGVRLERSVAAGWLQRAERLLEREGDCVERGYLYVRRSARALALHDLEAARDEAAKAEEIAGRFDDPDLLAYALHNRGLALVQLGQPEEGFELIDDATAAAVSGELGSLATATVYCNTISACRDIGDYGRAGEWTDAARRWCDRRSLTGFPGICRVHRAEVMRLRGAWSEAAEEAQRALEELSDFNLVAASAGFYELGEIRLRSGDFAGAEEAFRQANELGREPQPGIALLRLAQGKPDVARTALRRALADESGESLRRAKLLPAWVELSAAAGDVKAAAAAVEELETIANSYGTTAMKAAAAGARGVLERARGEIDAAIATLGRARRLWQEIDLPYEAARVRVELALAYRAAADDEAALLELEAAKAAFDRLGALPDARRVKELLGDEELPGDRVSRGFMFTDIADSTKLIEAIGDEAWETLVRWHDQTLRSLFADHGGEEVDHTGDGFFVAFPDSLSAIGCAVAIQRTLRDHRRSQGFAPHVRIGIHATEAASDGATYRGVGVHAAARISALAAGSEIVASRESVDGADVTASEPRSVALKGLSEPIEVVTIDWK